MIKIELLGKRLLVKTPVKQEYSRAGSGLFIKKKEGHVSAFEALSCSKEIINTLPGDLVYTHETSCHKIAESLNILEEKDVVFTTREGLIYRVLNKWILVEKTKWFKEEVNRNGIILPENTSVLNRGRVLKIGEKVVGINEGETIQVTGTTSGIETDFGVFIREKDVAFLGEEEILAPSFF